MRRSTPCIFGVALACSPAAPPPPAAQTTPVPSTSVTSEPSAVAVADAGPAKPPARTSECKPLRDNQVSADDHPEVAGTSPAPDDFSVLDWFQKRGVSEKVARGWYAARFGGKSEEARVEEMWCELARVGDPQEEALVCSVFTILELMPRRLVGIVVRNNLPVAVFQLGLGLRAMDFPDAHHLDLAFRLSADGKSFDVFDRAPDGTQLVLAPSECLAREKRGESTIPSEHLGLPATLHDCNGAKRVLAEMATTAKGDARFRGVVQGGASFVARSCADRGHYVWTKDRFVKGAATP